MNSKYLALTLLLFSVNFCLAQPSATSGSGFIIESVTEPFNQYDKFQMAFFKLYGLTTYAGNNQEVLADLGLLNLNDISLIKQTQLSGSFNGNAIRLLQRGCEYFEITQSSELDVLYLANVQSDAHDQELLDKELFFQNTFNELSVAAKGLVLEYISDIEYSGRQKRRTRINFVNTAETYPDEIKLSFSNLCDRLPAAIESIENNQEQIDVKVFGLEEN